MFILSSISSGLEYWLVHQKLIYEHSELKVFLKLNFLGEIIDQTIYLEQMYRRLSNQLIIPVNNITTSVISKWGIFSLFPALVILSLALGSNFIVSCVKFVDDILF